MIQIYSLTKAEEMRQPEYVIAYMNSEYRDKTSLTVFQGSEQEVLALMENGGLTGEEIDAWFETANPSVHRPSVVKNSPSLATPTSTS